MKPISAILLLLALGLIVLMCVATAVFLGFGALLAQWLPLSLFEAAAVAIGATITLVAFLHVIAAIMGAHAVDDFNGDFEDDDEDEDDDEFDADISNSDTSSPEPRSSKVGRNDPCPCGSGKKFKRCCGNAAPE
jgi:uncharacterized protein YchJ